jgi:hypothetical protein
MRVAFFVLALLNPAGDRNMAVAAEDGTSQFLLAFLGAFGLVLALGATFVAVYRHQLRRIRPHVGRHHPSAAIWGGPGSMPFDPPSRWLAIRSSNFPLLKEAFRGLLDPAASWSEALARVREQVVFLSPQVQGWTLVVGGGLPDPGRDVDVLYQFLMHLSRECGEVQFFCVDRVLSHHSWARLRDGRVIRAYAWAGETVWNEGRVTLDERLLGLRIQDYGEEAEPLRYGETTPMQNNCDRVLLLARRWSLDPVGASDFILHQEDLESDDDVSGKGER